MRSQKLALAFLGATRTVTGSKCVLHSGKRERARTEAVAAWIDRDGYRRFVAQQRRKLEEDRRQNGRFTDRSPSAT
jgi:hypothetical protein